MEKRKASPEQLNMLLHFMEEDKELAIGKFSGSNGKKRQTSAWIKIAEHLNANSGFGAGAIKSPDRWQQVWEVWKANVMKKALRISKNRCTRSSSAHYLFTDLEECVLRLTCDNPAAFGLPDLPKSNTMAKLQFHPLDPYFNPENILLNIEDRVPDSDANTERRDVVPGKILWKNCRSGARLIQDRLLSLEEDRMNIIKQKLLEKKRCHSLKLRIERDRVDVERQRNALLERLLAAVETVAQTQAQQ